MKNICAKVCNFRKRAYLCITEAMKPKGKQVSKMKYAIVHQDHPQAMRLQSIGWVLGTPSAHVKAGDFLMWNFGSVYSVSEIVKETAKTITITTSPKDKPCQIYTQRLFKDRLVCILK